MRLRAIPIDSRYYEPCNCDFCRPWREKTGQVGYVLRQRALKEKQ